MRRALFIRPLPSSSSDDFFSIFSMATHPQQQHQQQHQHQHQHQQQQSVSHRSGGLCSALYGSFSTAFLSFSVFHFFFFFITDTTTHTHTLSFA